MTLINVKNGFMALTRVAVQKQNILVTMRHEY